MKCKLLAFLWCAALALSATVPLAFGQSERLQQISPSQLHQKSDHAAAKHLAKAPLLGVAPAVTSSSLATWSYSILAYDGSTYTGQIVGRSPLLRGKTTTTVPVVLIPIKITINQGTGTYVGDPLGADPGCLVGTNTAVGLTQQSPLFNPSNISMGGNTPSPTFVGNTTFPDAFLRASFWQAIGGTASSAYHLALSVTTAPEQSLTYTVPSGGNSIAKEYGLSGTQCGTNGTNPNIAATIGVVNINVLDPQLQTIITNLGLTPDQFPFFILYYEVISDGAANNLNNCCILGYHNALGLPGQTYGIGEYDTGTVFGGVQDITALSHEVEEWIFDPTGVNPTPPWGNIGQVGGCQGNLEVGDPLSGTQSPPITMPNGVTYHPQEMAFNWWFFTPTSGGVNGVFSNNGTFTGNAKTCPPGGTN
jgi:hypothetical protein